MRFLHSADWRIGMAAVHAGEHAPRVRQARLDAARSAVDMAGRHGAEFILLAGDIFESNGVSRESVANVAAGGPAWSN